jgi:hypothetical protein
MFAEVLPTWKIQHFEVHSQIIIEQIEVYHEAVRRADLILMQPIHDGYRGPGDLASSFIRENIKSGCVVVTFPSIYFTGQHVGIRSIGIPDAEMDYQDVALYHMYSRGYRIHDVIGTFLNEDFYSRQEILCEINLSLAEMVRREEIDDIDLPISSYLKNKALERQLFHVVNHPYRAVMAEVANSYLSYIGMSTRVSIAGPDYLPYPHIPCHPSVTGLFSDRESSWAYHGGEPCFVWPGHKQKRSDYYRALSQSITRYSRLEIAELLQRSETCSAFIDRIDHLRDLVHKSASFETKQLVITPLVPKQDEKQKMSGNLNVVRQLRQEAAVRAVYTARPATQVVAGHVGIYDYAAQYIGADRPVTYLEFGVAQGRSIRMMAERFKNPVSQFIGFDSFVGLPEAWIHHDVGAFSNAGFEPLFEDGRVRFVKGWFQNTVSPFFKNFTLTAGHVVFVHFDSDLYSSNLFLLTSLWHNLQEYFFLMDDFLEDEVIAMHDFMAAYPISLKFMAQTGAGEEPALPRQVFGHMKRSTFHPPGESEILHDVAAWLPVSEFADALRHGWGAVEEWGVWGIGQRHTLVLDHSRASLLQVDCLAALVGPIERQTVTVIVDGELMATWHFSNNHNRGVRSVNLPDTDGAISVTFVPTTPVQPSAHDPQNADMRLLGLGLIRLHIKHGNERHT